MLSKKTPLTSYKGEVTINVVNGGDSILVDVVSISRFRSVLIHRHAIQITIGNHEHIWTNKLVY